METYLDIGLIITSIALITFVVLQSRGSGLGGLVGGEAGGIFSQRRGIERTMFQATIIISIIFFTLAIITVIVTG